jgi:hypothetical protein
VDPKGVDIIVRSWYECAGFAEFLIWVWMAFLGWVWETELVLIIIFFFSFFFFF